MIIYAPTPLFHTPVMLYIGGTHIWYNTSDCLHFETNLQQQVTAGRSTGSHARQLDTQGSLFAWGCMEMSSSVTERCKQTRIFTKSLTSHDFSLLLLLNLYFVDDKFCLFRKEVRWTSFDLQYRIWSKSNPTVLQLRVYGTEINFV